MSRRTDNLGSILPMGCDFAPGTGASIAGAEVSMSSVVESVEAGVEVLEVECHLDRARGRIRDGPAIREGITRAGVID